MPVGDLFVILAPTAAELRKHICGSSEARRQAFFENELRFSAVVRRQKRHEVKSHVPTNVCWAPVYLTLTATATDGQCISHYAARFLLLRRKARATTFHEGVARAGWDLEIILKTSRFVCGKPARMYVLICLQDFSLTNPNPTDADAAYICLLAVSSRGCTTNDAVRESYVRGSTAATDNASQRKAESEKMLLIIDSSCSKTETQGHTRNRRDIFLLWSVVFNG